LAPFFPTNTQRVLAQFTSKMPPRLEAQGRFLLPDWTNRQPDWAGAVWPTLSALGSLKSREGAFREFKFSSVEVPFTLTNLLWHVPALQLTRPEGTLTASGQIDQRTGDFQSRVSSGIDLKTIKSLFPRPKDQRVFDFFQFTVPPAVRAVFHGRAGDRKSIGLDADVQVTNASFRGESAEGCT